MAFLGVAMYACVNSYQTIKYQSHFVKRRYLLDQQVSCQPRASLIKLMLKQLSIKDKSTCFCHMTYMTTKYYIMCHTLSVKTRFRRSVIFNTMRRCILCKKQHTVHYICMCIFLCLCMHAT